MIIVAGHAALKHTNGWNDNKPKAWPSSNCTGGFIAIVIILILIVIIIIIVVIIIIIGVAPILYATICHWW